jgi:hypothetical protein
MPTSTPHDDLFKAAFEDPHSAAGLLRSILPPALVAALDWSTIRLESGALRKAEGGERRNDLLFSVCFRDSKAGAYFPIEHQSNPQVAMPLRGLGYTTSLWQRLLEAGGLGKGARLRLPLIVPVLVSNAPRGWRGPTSVHDLLHPHPSEFPGLSPPNLEFIVDDLFHQSDSQLQSRPLGPFPKLALWALRDGRSVATIVRTMPAWAATIREAALAPDKNRTFAHLSNYIGALHPTKLPFERFHAKLIELVPETKEPVMSYIEQLREDARKEGLQAGHQAGSVQNGRNNLRLLLTTKFGHLPSEYADRIEAADELQLQQWLVRILDADAIEGVFSED